MSGWLHNLGINMGDQMLGAHDCNSKGHFEDLELLNFHKRVAADLGIHDWKEASQNVNWEAKHFKEAENLVITRNRNHKQWGWKDPRLCLYLSEWIDVLDNPFIVVVYREATAVAESLQKREIANYLKRYKLSLRNGTLQVAQSILQNRFRMYVGLWKDYNLKILSDLENYSNIIYISQARLKSDLVLLKKVLLEKEFTLLNTQDVFVDTSLFSSRNIDHSKQIYADVILELNQRRQKYIDHYSKG